MQRSESITLLAAALVKAQANIGAATKGSENPFFKSSYADLGTVMSVCKHALLDQGINILQLVGRDEIGDYLETIILHESGEFISDRMRLVCSKVNDPQAMGSAITYARRYALQSAMFIPAVDDDGEKAMVSIREAESRQDNREKAAASAPKGIVQTSDPLEEEQLDKINQELSLRDKRTYGYPRKRQQTAGV